MKKRQIEKRLADRRISSEISRLRYHRDIGYQKAVEIQKKNRKPEDYVAWIDMIHASQEITGTTQDLEKFLEAEGKDSTFSDLKDKDKEGYKKVMERITNYNKTLLYTI